MPHISVIVPVYNAQYSLNRCIDSILNQSFADFELILVDDGSQDESFRICEEYLKVDERVKAIHKENGGVSSARNTGLDVACGEYIAFIDSDDYIEADYLELFWNNRTDLTIAPHATYDEEDKFLYSDIYREENYPAKDEIDFVYLCNKLFSPYCRLFRADIIREHLIRFSDNLTWGEDAVFVAQYVQYINCAKTLSKSGYHYIKYKKEDTLSTRVRYDIVDMISKSRKMYLTYLLNVVSDELKEKIVSVIEEDICQNCAYFVTKLLESKTVKYSEKKSYLNHFLANIYVKRTILNRKKYYKIRAVRLCLKCKYPVLAYYFIFPKKGLKYWIKKLVGLYL